MSEDKKVDKIKEPIIEQGEAISEEQRSLILKYQNLFEQEMVESATKTQQTLPEGYKVLKEGQANLLYIEEQMEKDEQNTVRNVTGGRRQANEVNETRGAVFYNPVQEFNRDTSILVINEFNEMLKEERAAKNKTHDQFRVFEALAATGLRSVRYMKEIPAITQLVGNDIDKAATDLMKKNFEFNDCPQDKYQVQTSDAIDLMNQYRRDKTVFDVVDLDPYGTAIPFLEGAITSLANNGLLCVTFTDMAVLCARQPHVCFYKYGASPLGKPYCHEQALRMVLYTINTMANKHGKRVEPLISLTVDFYVRLFMRVKSAPQECHQSIRKYSNIYQCTFCESFYTQPLGEALPYKEKNRKTKNQKKGKLVDETKKAAQGTANQPAEESKETSQKPVQMRMRTAMNKIPTVCGTCGSQLTIGGPIWNQPIHNVAFAKRLLARAEQADCSLKTVGRIKGILGGIIDEEPLQDMPLNFNLHDVCSTIRAQNPSKSQIHAAFASLGYKLCQTYYAGDLWKTDAPPEAVYDIFKKWKQQSPNQNYLDNVPETSPARIILEKERTYEADFSFKVVEEENEDGVKAGTKRLMRKYFKATEPNWGPKPRATGGKKAKLADETTAPAQVEPAAE